jgi:hypothetical protein
VRVGKGGSDGRKEEGEREKKEEDAREEGVRMMRMMIVMQDEHGYQLQSVN